MMSDRKTQPLWPDWSPLAIGDTLSIGSVRVKVLTLEGQWPDLNLYRAYSLTPLRRCPICGNDNTPNALACIACRADLSSTSPTHVVLRLYESRSAGQLRLQEQIHQRLLYHPHLLSPLEVAEVRNAASPSHWYVLMPDDPAPRLQSLTMVQHLPAILTWGAQIAEALSLLHNAGIVHGTLSTGRMIVRGDRAWLACEPVVDTLPDQASMQTDVRTLVRVLLAAVFPHLDDLRAVILPPALEDMLATVQSDGPSEGAPDARTLVKLFHQASEALQFWSKIRFRSSWRTDPGRQRALNEDSLFACSFDVVYSGVRIPAGLYLVADGAGGHVAGELASRLTVQTLVTETMRQIVDIWLRDMVVTYSTVEQEIRSAFHLADAAVRQAQQISGDKMYSTATLLLLLGNKAFVANIGDSRLYRYRTGDLEQVTEDHSTVQRLISLARLSKAEARVHPKRNEVYRYVGHAEDLEPDLFRFSLELGEVIVLNSDGLNSEIEDETMLDILSRQVDLEEASQTLLEAALAAGGRDNISVLLISPLPA